MIEPNTEVRLLKAVPLSNDYEHQLKFPDQETQYDYFNKKLVKKYLDFTYQRISESLVVPDVFDLLYEANYIMFQNKQYGSKWFYGFITNKEYINPNATRIFFELDVWQSYQFDIEFKESFIDREHCNRWENGKPVINTVPENLDIGTEYDIVKNHVYEGGTTNYYLMTSTASLVEAFKKKDVPSSPPLPKPKIVQGLLTALDFYLFSDKDSSMNPDIQPEDPGSWDGVSKGLNEKVESYRDMVTRYCQEYKIDLLVDLCLAVMMVESKGEGNDPMQSSDYARAMGGEVTNPEMSINWGVQFMAYNVEQQVKLNVDTWSMVQSYNFGTSYMRWIAKRGKAHTTDLAEEYSRDVVAPSLGNTSKKTVSYVNAVSKADGRMYRYENGGNFHYVGLVKQYYTLVESTLARPVPKSSVVSSWFGMRDGRMHNGIDLADQLNTPVYAAKGGKVIYAQFHTNSDGSPGFGNYVVIDHKDGMFTGYAHLNTIDTTVNSEVQRGERIGKMGTTGSSTGVHLHFNVSDGLFGNYQDPAPLLGLKR